MLIAALCVYADLSIFGILWYVGSFGGPGSQLGLVVPDAAVGVLLIAGIVVVDVAVALPMRHAGKVALCHALFGLVTVPIVPTWQAYRLIAPAGLAISHYQAGAWLRGGQAALVFWALFAAESVRIMITVARIPWGWVTLGPVLVAYVVLPWLVGRFTTARRAHLAALEAEAALQGHNEQLAVQRAVADERSAVARDLHDVISHHVSAIRIHAGAARLSLDGDEAGHARRSLSDVESASRSAMVDLRRMLDVLHGRGAADAQRQPGLGNLDELLDRVRAAGVPVRLTVRGTPRDLAGSRDIALYRIAQETLTNAMRYRAGGPVDVVLDYRADRVRLVVTNDVDPAARRERGQRHRGLIGVRERVALIGADITYGPAQEGTSWQIRVDLPLDRQ
ncbi:histidine kinase [Actinokineospora soli]